MREGWVKTTLGEVAAWYSGATPKASRREYYGGDIPWAVVADVNNRPISATAKSLTPEGLAQVGRVAPVGSVMVTMYGSIGRSALVEREMASNQAIAWGVPAGDVLSDFLFLLTRHHEADLDRLGRGATQRNINREIIRKFEVLIPPIEEQRRIVDLMGHVDKAISETHQETEGLERYHWSLADSMISSAKGAEVRLGAVSTIVRGGSPRPIDEYYTEAPEGLPWVRIGDVAADGKYITHTEKKIDPKGLGKTRTVAPGDFVLSNSMSFGRPYIVQLHGCIHDGWLKISDYEETFTADFLYYLLRSNEVQEQFQSRAAGSGVRNLKKESVGDTMVMAPSLDYQMEVTTILSTVAAQVATTRGVLSLLQELRRVLLSALLSGRSEIPASYDDLIRDEGAA